MPTNLDIFPLGDFALLIRLGERIDPLTNSQAHHLARALEQTLLPGIGEMVPAYASLMVHYDPLVLDYATMVSWVEKNAAEISDVELSKPRMVEIPVLYGASYGPDLEFVAQHCSLPVEEVIRRHSSATYTVYMLGFMPGFAYLGGLPAELASPRLETPRTHIKAGSVGIAGSQAGIYPLDSPGGWRIIGWTPLRLFDSLRNPPTLLSAGDQVRFTPVSSLEKLNEPAGS